MKLLAVSALALLLAGCVGGPPAAVGDVVSLRIDSYDADTGALLRIGENRTFEVLSGGSGLGIEFERGFIGLQTDDAVSLVVPGNPQASFQTNTPLTFEREFGPNRLVETYPTSDVQAFVGHPLTVGEEFSAGKARLRVESIQGDDAVLRLLVEDGARILDDAAMYAVYRVEGDAYFVRLEPIVGAVFVVDRDHPALGLPAGAYLQLEPTETELRLGYTSQPGPFPQGVGHASVRLEITVEHVAKSVDAGTPGDNFAVRGSPQLQGKPSLQPVPSN